MTDDWATGLTDPTLTFEAYTKWATRYHNIALKPTGAFV